MSQTKPKPIAVFDIDGTIFRSSLLIELTSQLISSGIFPAIIQDQYTHEYHAWLNRQGSYEVYLSKLIAAFAQHIKGLAPATLEAAADQVIAHSLRQTYRYTRDLIASLKDNHFLVAISGSPVEMVARFAHHYGFRDYRGTRYLLKNGLYTGECIVNQDSKDQAVIDVLERHHLTLAGSVGVGDTESDAAFLNLVERPIAFNPNSALFQIAATNNWQVVVERKDVIYYYNHGESSRE